MVMSTEPGRKDDQQKNRVDLLPVDALQEVAKVLTHGANKYGDYNWSSGISYHRCYGALLRHMFAWWIRQDVDPETGLSHLAHACCNVLFLLAFTLRGKKEFDTRP
jgi:hypothetical protein